MSNNPPTGTITFLFTDIEGSTRRWEANATRMLPAHARQEAIMRQAIEAHGGYAYKMIGDAFQAAFPTAPQALAAAVHSQRDLHSEAWPSETGEVKVRMALHTGITQERDGDYVGPLLNRVARLMSAAHGGQVLLSLATAELLRDHLPSGVTLKDMGEHRLKDLTRPEHIFQLVCEDLPSEFPPLKTLDNRPNNLPLQPTPFIGREKELSDLGSLLKKEETHLLTLTGPGGTGKTRLSLQVAAEVLDEFPDGVWFVELAALAPTEHKLVTSSVAQALGVTEAAAAGKPLISSLQEHFKEKRLLLVLDNFEQVVDAAPQVGQLLSGSSGLKVLVSSRVKLNIYGEREYAVPALSLPDIRQGHLPPLERLTQYEAVRLFIERAQAAKADFQVTNSNAPAVAEICVRLDGLPLAIELAAARVKMLPPQALLTRLSSRLKLLTGGGRDLTARQQTLRGAIDWSYDLLDEGEKQLFRRMAVFQGGRTLEALEEVCNADGIQVYGQLEVEVFDGVQSLLDKSLIQQREGSDGEPRFVMLETIHEYAREKLGEGGEGEAKGEGEAEALEREHALYFMRLAEEAEPHLTGKEQQGWLDRLKDEYDNLRAALAWAGEQTEAEPANNDADLVGLRTAGAIWRFWLVKGLYTEGRENLERALSITDRSDISDVSEAERQEESLSTAKRRSKAKALNGAGSLAWRQGDFTATRASVEAALVLGREVGDKQSMASSLNTLGNVALGQGDYTRARALYEESLTLRREIGDGQGISASLNNVGLVAEEQGDYTRARALYEESLTLFRKLEDKRGVSMSLINLGNVALEQRDCTTACTLYDESLVLRRELGDKQGISACLNNVGLVAYEQGDYTKARALYEESLTLLRELGDKVGISMSLSNLGGVAEEQGDYTGARALLEESLAMRRELGDKVGIAACLAGLGGVAVGMGQVERGAGLLGAVEGLLQSIGAVLYSENSLRYQRSVQQTRTLLGEEEFERAWQEGRSMSVEEAIEYALEATVGSRP